MSNKLMIYYTVESTTSGVTTSESTLTTTSGTTESTTGMYGVELMEQLM
jgi:hypothetical protein